MAIFFYSRTDEYGDFSNFASFGVGMDDCWWPTVEHYFQAQKFHDLAYREKIRTAHSAKQAANLGRSRSVKIRGDWEQIKDSVMETAVLKKFQTHKTLRTRLIGTGGQKIFENSPGDYYWGIGRDGTGLNKLGTILVNIRATLSNTN